MADRKILFRSGANVNEASPTADRARLIGLLSGAATLTLENSGGQTAVLGSSALTLSSGVNITGTGTAHVTGFTDATFAGDVAVNGGDLTTTATTMNVANANATTVNAFGAGTTINLGAAGSTLATGLTAITTSQATASVFNTTATTGNIFGAATAIEIGATTGTTSINNSLSVDGNTTLGNASADTIDLVGQISTATVQFTDAAHTVQMASATTGPADTLTVLGQTLTATAFKGGNVQITAGGTTGAATGGGGSLLLNGGTGFVGAPNGQLILNNGAGGILSPMEFGTTVSTVLQFLFGNTTDNPPTIFQGSGAVRSNTDTVAGSSLGASTFGWGALWMRNVADDETVNLRASTANSSGAEAVGFDPTGLTVVTATNVQDAIEQLDAGLTDSGSVVFTAGATIDSGTIVRISATDTVIMAIATSEAAARVVGVAEAAITASATGVITTGYGGHLANLRLINGETPTVNADVFASDTVAGRGQMAAPTASGSVIKKIAVTKDVTAYVTVTNPFVEAIFQPEPGTLIA